MDKANSAFSKLLKDNPSFKFLLPVLLLALIALVVLYLPKGTDGDPSQGLPAATEAGGLTSQVEVLPQVERNDADELEVTNNPFAAGDSVTLSVTGILETASGHYRAVVNFDGGAMIVEEGNYLGATNWMVEKIDLENVYLTSPAGDKVLTLESDTIVS